MKQFHFLFGLAQNKKQFEQLCNDMYKEIHEEKIGKTESVAFFNDYYNTNLSLWDLAQLGKYIESGLYLQELSRYV